MKFCKASFLFSLFNLCFPHEWTSGASGISGLPPPAGALYPLCGFMTNPVAAAACMAAATVCIATNSLRLRK